VSKLSKHAIANMPHQMISVYAMIMKELDKMYELIKQPEPASANSWNASFIIWQRMAAYAPSIR
jgi:hypothetical protein